MSAIFLKLIYIHLVVIRMSISVGELPLGVEANVYISLGEGCFRE